MGFPHALVIKINKEKGTSYLKLPKTKMTFDLGKTPIKGKLKEIRIVPKGVGYTLELVCQVPNDKKQPSKEESKRIIALDLGVNNFATMTNNIGEKPIIIKGKAIKSKNQYYNKQRAYLYSKLREGKQPNEGTFTSKRLQKLDMKRHFFMKDTFHKISKKIITYCEYHKIDTIVIGKNDGWKPKLKMDKTNKQKFVFIPYNLFISMLTYKAKEKGILVLMQEESYTSKASFLDQDVIPTYGKEKEEPKFSGKRICRGLC